MLRSTIIVDLGGDDMCLMEVSKKEPEGVYLQYRIETPGESGSNLLNAAYVLTFWMKDRCGYEESLDVWMANETLGKNKFPDQTCPVCLDDCGQSIYACGHPLHEDCFCDKIECCPMCKEEGKNGFRSYVGSLELPNEPDDVDFHRNVGRVRRWASALHSLIGESDVGSVEEENDISTPEES